MKKQIKPFEFEKISQNPLDEVQIGDWYWVIDEGDGEKKENLMCVENIGSNYIMFSILQKYGSSYDKIHFDKFFALCRPEPKWKDILQKRMKEIQKSMQEKTQQLVKQGKELYLLPQEQKEKSENEDTDENKSFLPMKVADEHKQYKKSLIKFQNDKIPKISKEIEELGVEFGSVAKNMALSDLVKLNVLKEKLNVVEDRIFTIELYCGLQEYVKQIAEGEPAPYSEKIAIRQSLLYMDEETLFDYEEGGMDFKSIDKFDKWVTKKENLERIFPEPKGIVAFKVRRHKKEYGEITSFLDMFNRIGWEDANKKTYLLIRNGGNIYRIESEIDFSPRLIPFKNEIGDKQFEKINERFDWVKDKYDRTKEMVGPDHLEYDNHVKKLDNILKQYNRIVILLQGLMDRSTIFHPHPPIKLTIPGVMDKWVNLIRDEERALPSNKVNFEEYQKQLNSSIKSGKWIYIDGCYDERWKDGEKPYREYSNTPKRGWSVNAMPKFCKVDSIKRDKSAVKVSWPWGKCHTVKKFVDDPKRPGWGWNRSVDTGRMCHEWIPLTRVLNVSDYHMGDYKMFLCDRSLKGEYLKWSKYLLNAEDWQQRRAKGIKPEDDKKAKVG